MGVLRTRRLGTQVLGKERVHVNADRVALAPAGAGLKPNGDPPRGAEVGGLGAVEAVVVPWNAPTATTSRRARWS